MNLTDDDLEAIAEAEVIEAEAVEVIERALGTIEALESEAEAVTRRVAALTEALELERSEREEVAGRLQILERVVLGLVAAEGRP